MKRGAAQQLARGLARLIPSGLIPAAALRALHELVDSAEAVHRSHLGTVPAWLLPLFDQEGGRHQVPPLLLAAVAGALSGFEPAMMRRAPSQVGLAGVPLHLVESYAATDLVTTTEALSAREPAAVDALRANVGEAARILAQLAGESRDWPAAVLQYVACGQTDPAALRLAEDVLGRFALYALKQLPADTLGAVRATLPRK